MATPAGGVRVDQEKGCETEAQNRNGLSLRGGNNDETARPNTVSGQAINSLPMIFIWKGHNYLVKMAHDLDFLDDESEAAPVPTWLGFSVHGNPFLIPPEGHDICDILLRGREERRKGIAARRRQRQQQQHRFGGTGSGQRRFSRARSRSRSNSGINRQRGSGDGDLPATSSHRLSGQGHESESDRRHGSKTWGGVVPPESTEISQHQHHQPMPPNADPKATKRGLPQRAGSTANMAPAMALPGEEGGETFVTGGGMIMTDGSFGSATTSVDPPPLWGLGDFRDEDIPCELSSGEEEEVQWNGGMYLDDPIIPCLPEVVRSKASAAAETLRSEDAARRYMESSALEIVANVKRTQEILHQSNQELSSKVEWLSEKSCRNGLRGALVDRHVGATRLKSAASASCRRDEPLVRRVSTAPARGVGPAQRAQSFCAGWAIAKRPTSTQEGGAHRSAAFGTSRGGVCVSVDGRAENGDDERTQDDHETLTPAGLHRLASGSASSTSRRGGASASRLRRRPYRASAGTSEGRSTGSTSATSLAERSMAASSSLQASSSSMSARARARAVAIRPTAMRRPFCPKSGRIIITDPGKSPEIRRKAAIVIQAAFLAVCARRSVRQLRDHRECAALLIGRNWRRSRVRLRMWNAKRSRRAEELRQVADGRTRNRAAHVLQTFFRDIKYRRKRVRCVIGMFESRVCDSKRVTCG